MKLINRQQVNIESSLIKKKLIDEGVSIAKKIDKMREDYLSLQKQRADFIEGTKLEIIKQTKTEQDKYDRLKVENNILLKEIELNKQKNN